MEYTHINEELKYLNINYSFEKALSVSLILNQIFQFLNKDNIKSLTLCNKKIYQSYCNLIKNVKIDKETDILNFKILIDKYININNLDLSYCNKIKDFISISKLKRLEFLNVRSSNISDISFLEKNKNIEKLNLRYCENIKDFTPISKLERLKILNSSYTNISNITFLEKNKNIKELNFRYCENIKDLTPISKLERLEFLNVSWTNISDISLLKKNKNIKELNLHGCKNIKDYSILSILIKNKIYIIY